MCMYKKKPGGFPGGAVVESLPASAGDTGWSPGLGRSLKKKKKKKPGTLYTSMLMVVITWC